MKKSPRTFVPLAVVTFLAISGCSAQSSTAGDDCTPEWDFDPIEEGVLTVAAVGTLPYVDIAPGEDQAAGVDGLFYSEFAERACLTPRFDALGGPAATAAITEGQADVAAGGWYATPERAETIGQTSAVWTNYSGIVSSTGISTVPDLQGSSVGVVSGSIYMAPLEEAIGTENVRQYQTADAMIQDLNAGRIDAGMGTALELSHQVDARGDSELEVLTLEEDPEYPELTEAGSVNFPHDKSNEALGEALEAFIEDIQANGTVEDVLAEYGADDPEFAGDLADGG